MKARLSSSHSTIRISNSSSQALNTNTEKEKNMISQLFDANSLREQLTKLTNSSGWQEEFCDDYALKEKFISMVFEKFPPEIIAKIVKGAASTKSDDLNFYDVKIDTADLFRCLENSASVKIVEIPGIEPKPDFSCKYVAILYEMQKPDWQVIYDKSAPYEKCASEKYGLIYSLKEGAEDRQTLLIFE